MSPTRIELVRILEEFYSWMQTREQEWGDCFVDNASTSVQEFLHERYAEQFPELQERKEHR